MKDKKENVLPWRTRGEDRRKEKDRMETSIRTTSRRGI